MGVRDLNEMREKVAERVEEKKKLPGKKSGGDSGPPLSFISKCFRSNEVGDSLLYNHLHLGKYIYNTISKEWLAYKGTRWVIDYNGEALAACEDVAKEYLKLLKDNEDRLSRADKSEVKSLMAMKKAIIYRLDRLRSKAGRISVLGCCNSNSEPLVVHPDQLDQYPMLLPAANSVIDLRTGEGRPGRPDDYLTLASPIEWKGIDEPSPHWEKYLMAIIDNQEVVDYLHRVLGYAITGLNTERIFLVLFGKHGQNGKGTMMEILFKILASLSGPIQSEMLMSQKFSKSASGPSPEIVALKGKRLSWASETEEGQSFAAGRIKLFSGGDPLTGRGINDRSMTTFLPSHTLFLLTNNLPHAPAQDNGFWERIKVIDFPYTFLKDKKPKESYERRVDPKLFGNLMGEASGILAWLVRGCLLYQKHGLAPPEKVIKDSTDYRRTEDDLQDFIEECCSVNKEDKKCREAASLLYGKYKTWWHDERSPSRPMSAKKFGDLMGRKGFEKLKSHGVMIYLGLRLNLDEPTP